MLFAKQFSWTSKSVPIDFLRKSAGLAKVFYRGEYKLLKKERIRILSIVNKGLYKFCLRLKVNFVGCSEVKHYIVVTNFEFPIHSTTMYKHSKQSTTCVSS